MGALRRCETEPESRGSAGGGGESARCDEGTRARGPERGDTAGNGSGNGNRDDGPMETLRGAIAVESERQAVHWINGPGKTGSNDVGDENLRVKPGEDESVGRRGALQLEVQELELEQQPSSLERKKRNTEGAAGPRRGDTGAAGSRGGDTRDTAGSRG